METKDQDVESVLAMVIWHLRVLGGSRAEAKARVLVVGLVEFVLLFISELIRSAREKQTEEFELGDEKFAYTFLEAWR